VLSSQFVSISPEQYTYLRTEGLSRDDVENVIAVAINPGRALVLRTPGDAFGTSPVADGVQEHTGQEGAPDVDLAGASPITGAVVPKDMTSGSLHQSRASALSEETRATDVDTMTSGQTPLSGRKRTRSGMEGSLPSGAVDALPSSRAEGGECAVDREAKLGTGSTPVAGAPDGALDSSRRAAVTNSSEPAPAASMRPLRSEAAQRSVSPQHRASQGGAAGQSGRRLGTHEDEKDNEDGVPASPGLSPWRERTKSAGSDASAAASQSPGTSAAEIKLEKASFPEDRLQRARKPFLARTPHFRRCC